MDRSNKEKGQKRKIKRIEQYFNFYGKILRVFFENNDTYLYKNKIFEMINKNSKKEQGTGLSENIDNKKHRVRQQGGTNSKRYCITAVDLLHRFGLLELINIGKDSRKDKYKLSDKGMSIVKLHFEMDDYQQNYLKLVEAIDEKIPNKSYRGKLVLKHHYGVWKDQEIEFYHVFRSNALDLKDLMDKSFMNIILLRYSKIIDDPLYHNNENNNKIKIILDDIIIKVLVDKARYVLERYKIYEESGNARWIENYRDPINQASQYEEKYETGTMGTLPFYNDIVNFFNYKIIPSTIKKESTSMILSYLKLLGYPKDKISKEDIIYFFENKYRLIKEYIFQHKDRQSDINHNYNYENLINLRFDTQELFQKILNEYVK